MAFRPDNPTDADYREPIADWLLDAIPGARELDDAAAAAQTAFLDAQRRAIEVDLKLCNLSERNDPKHGPRAGVKRTDWNKTDDAAREARAAVRPSQLAAARAYQARFELLYGTKDEPGAMDSPNFAAKVEPLYTEASRRAKEHLDALVAALTERDKFASAMGRVISIDGGWFGLAQHVGEVEAYIDAGLNDEEADAWVIVERALRQNYATTATKMAVLTACRAIQEDTDIPASEKVHAYLRVLKMHAMANMSPLQ